jgi:hypothetical protein
LHLRFAFAFCILHLYHCSAFHSFDNKIAFLHIFCIAFATYIPQGLDMSVGMGEQPGNKGDQQAGPGGSGASPLNGGDGAAGGLQPGAGLGAAGGGSANSGAAGQADGGSSPANGNDGGGAGAFAEGLTSEELMELEQDEQILNAMLHGSGPALSGQQGILGPAEGAQSVAGILLPV